MAPARRYAEIVTILVKYGFADAVRALHLTPYLRAGRRLVAARGSAPLDSTRARRIRLALEELGPAFVKFGQALSTHADLLPPDVIAELEQLQDAVAPLPDGEAERAIESALGKPVAEVFAAFDGAPIAAASIAQVHEARLASGERVAIKVRRPNIERTIEDDLAVLADLARLAEHHLPDAKLYSLTGLVDEFARAIRRELDLAREGRIIDRVAAQFAGDPTLHFPRIHWPLTTAGVLTMEFVDGVKVSALADPPAFDPVLVAQRGADFVFRQILVHGLFHADPHPGNILVLPDNVVAFIDFGIVGRVSRSMRERLTQVILAIGRHDPDRLAELVLAIATPLAPVDADALSGDIAEMLDLYGDVPIGRLSMRSVFASITATVARHRLRLPADVLLLIKAVTTIESVGSRLDPSFRIVASATPHIEGLVAEKRRPGAVTRRAVHESRDVLKALSAIPANVAAITGRARREGLRIDFVHRNLEYFVREMDRASNRLSFAVVIAAIVVASSIVVHASVGPTAFGYPMLGLIGFVTAGWLGIGLAIGILKSGRL